MTFLHFDDFIIRKIEEGDDKGNYQVFFQGKSFFIRKDIIAKRSFEDSKHFYAAVINYLYEKNREEMVEYLIKQTGFVCKEEKVNPKQKVSSLCEHNWVMDGHNSGDSVCSKCHDKG